MKKTLKCTLELDSRWCLSLHQELSPLEGRGGDYIGEGTS